jgi:2-C-methyl-D-erythritol 4-phosphate cytidylyltransferase
MTPAWRSVTAGAVVIVVGDEDPDPDAALVERLSAHLVEAELDAVAQWVPVTDALVRLDSDGSVTDHLDRDHFGRPGLPQVVALEWWNRFRGEVGERQDESPVLAVGRLGGRIGVLDEVHPGQP